MRSKDEVRELLNVYDEQLTAMENAKLKGYSRTEYTMLVSKYNMLKWVLKED